MHYNFLVFKGGSPGDLYECIKPIKFKIDDIDPNRRFVNPFSDFSPLCGVRPQPGLKTSGCYLTNTSLMTTWLQAHESARSLKYWMQIHKGSGSILYHYSAAALVRAALRRAFDLVVGLKLLDFSFGCRGLFLPRTYRLTHRIIESYMIQVWARDIHIECSKQFKWNSYFYVSGQSGPFGAVLKLLEKPNMKFE